METTSDTTKILVKGPEYLRRQMELESETKGHKSAVERLAASKPKYVKSQQVVNSTQELVISPGSPSVSSTELSNHNPSRGESLLKGTNSTVGIQICSPGQVGQVRQASSKKRRDSLLLYRQKCDLLKGAANDQKFHMTPKLLLSSVKKNVPLPETDKDDFDAFFKYCGLDGEVIESLGKENFSARSDEIEINIRSVSVSTSDGGFSENSGDSDGLLDAQLQEKVQQGTSVIERNARIIKWLYSCKNAIETGKTLRDLD
uniref:protein FAM110C n=1 Tax=Monopterus albus TaxID=43700 RepID=UPI0009B4BFF5|nr:protein FAM110C [Monopterus albus]